MRQVALVTGASSGIGYAFANILAQNQYDLILVARNAQKLLEVKTGLVNRFGVEVHIIVTDLTQAEAIEKIYRDLKTRNIDVDVLVNNAGIGDWGPFIDSPWDKQEELLQLNITALTHLTKVILPGMVKRRRGKVLNVASTAAFQPGPLMAVYYASKAYVLSLSSAIGYELKGTGVTVTCLCPGPTATGFQEATFTEEIRLMHGKKLPTAEEVAAYGYKAMVQGKSVAVPGIGNKILVIGSRFLPQGLILKIVHFLQESL